MKTQWKQRVLFIYISLGVKSDFFLNARSTAHTHCIYKNNLSRINMQHLESSSASLPEASFPLLVLRASYFKKCVRGFQALRGSCVQTINFFIRFWVEVPTHGHTGSVSFQGLRRWTQLHSHKPEDRGEFLWSGSHSANCRYLNSCI